MDVDLQLRDLERQARERSGGRPVPLRDWLALAEAWRITEALRDARGNRAAAARALGIGRRTLYTKMEKLGVTPVWLVRDDARSSAAASPKQQTVASGPRPGTGLIRARS
jgi:hypothetical protein